MSAITKEVVFEAADRLVEEGVNPTVATVRGRLGKGSFTTINEFMRQWREGQKAPEFPTKEVAPQALTDRLLEFGNGLWSAAMELASESLRAEREALEQLKKEMDEEQQETVAFADNLANEVDVLRMKNTELEGVLEVERTKHDNTRNLYNAESGEVIKLRAELEGTKLRTEDFKEQLNNSRVLLNTAEAENKKYVERDIKNQSIIAKLENEVDKINRELKQQVEMLVHELENEREKVAKAEKASESDRAAAQQFQIEAAQLRGEVEILNKQVAQQAKLFESLTASPKSK